MFNYKNLDIIYDVVDDIIISNGKASGIICGEIKIISNSVVITSGTFLNGVIHIGSTKYNAGRFGEKSITVLAEKLKSYKFNIGRLKTGTPPRILKQSINFLDRKGLRLSILIKTFFNLFWIYLKNYLARNHFPTFKKGK